MLCSSWLRRSVVLLVPTGVSEEPTYPIYETTWCHDLSFIYLSIDIFVSFDLSTHSSVHPSACLAFFFIPPIDYCVCLYIYVYTYIWPRKRIECNHVVNSAFGSYSEVCGLESFQKKGSQNTLTIVSCTSSVYFGMIDYFKTARDKFLPRHFIKITIVLLLYIPSPKIWYWMKTQLPGNNIYFPSFTLCFKWVVIILGLFNRINWHKYISILSLLQDHAQITGIAKCLHSVNGQLHGD
jgi:hypothetical protein